MFGLWRKSEPTRYRCTVCQCQWTEAEMPRVITVNDRGGDKSYCWLCAEVRPQPPYPNIGLQCQGMANQQAAFTQAEMQNAAMQQQWANMQTMGMAQGPWRYGGYT